VLTRFLDSFGLDPLPNAQLSFPARLAGLFAAVVLLSSCGEGITRSVSATILETRGTVRAKSGPDSQFGSAEPGLALGAGALLQTDEAAQADLALLPNILARILSRTDLTINGLKLSKDGNETGDAMIARRAEISLGEGAIFLKHRRPPGSFGSLLVKTPHASITANSDCLIYIETTPRRLRVICVRGLVEIAPASGQKAFSAEAGSMAELPSQTSSLVAVAGDAAAQEKVSDAISAERELLALARGRRNLLPR
jgi:hypothetical protein